jgi:hypothetical protein
VNKSKNLHILLRGPDGKLYAFEAAELENHLVSPSGTGLDDYEDDLKIIQTMAFNIDENIRPNAKGNTCAFADAAIANFKNVQPNDKFIYVNLDFRLDAFDEE